MFAKSVFVCIRVGVCCGADFGDARIPAFAGRQAPLIAAPTTGTLNC